MGDHKGRDALRGGFTSIASFLLRDEAQQFGQLPREALADIVAVIDATRLNLGDPEQPKAATNAPLEIPFRQLADTDLRGALHATGFDFLPAGRALAALETAIDNTMKEEPPSDYPSLQRRTVQLLERIISAESLPTITVGQAWALEKSELPSLMLTRMHRCWKTLSSTIGLHFVRDAITGMISESLPLPKSLNAGRGPWPGVGRGPSAEPMLWLDTPAVSNKPDRKWFRVRAAESFKQGTWQAVYWVVANHGNELSEFTGIQLASTLRDHASYFDGQLSQEPYDCHPESMRLDGRTWRQAAHAQGVIEKYWGPDEPYDTPLTIAVARSAVHRMPWLLKGVARNTTAIAATGSSEAFEIYAIRLPTRFSLCKPQTTVGVSRAKRHLSIVADLRRVLYWSDTPMAGMARQCMLMGWVVHEPSAQALNLATGDGSRHWRDQALDTIRAAQVPVPGQETLATWSEDEILLFTAGLPSYGMECIPTGAELYPGTLCISGQPQWTTGLYDFMPSKLPGVTSTFTRRVWCQEPGGPPEASVTFYSDGAVVFWCGRFCIKGKGNAGDIKQIKWDDFQMPPHVLQLCWLDSSDWSAEGGNVVIRNSILTVNNEVLLLATFQGMRQLLRERFVFHGMNVFAAAEAFRKACDENPAGQPSLNQPDRAPDVTQFRDSATTARLTMSLEEAGEMECQEEDGPLIPIEVQESQPAAMSELLTLLTQTAHDANSLALTRELIASDILAGIFPMTTPWFLVSVTLMHNPRKMHAVVAELADILQLPAPPPQPDLLFCMASFLSAASSMLPVQHLPVDWESRLDDGATDRPSHTNSA